VVSGYDDDQSSRRNTRVIRAPAGQRVADLEGVAGRDHHDRHPVCLLGRCRGERIGEPHVRHIDGKLWEMRPSGKRTEGRALYVTATGRRVVIVLAFIKKTRKTPDRMINLAHERARSIGP
jgi:Phage derived protein Gp49-like (DUF891)